MVQQQQQHNIKYQGKQFIDGYKYDGTIKPLANESFYLALMKPAADRWRGRWWRVRASLRLISIPILKMLMTVKNYPPPNAKKSLHAYKKLV